MAFPLMKEEDLGSHFMKLVPFDVLICFSVAIVSLSSLFCWVGRRKKNPSFPRLTLYLCFRCYHALFLLYCFLLLLYFWGRESWTHHYHNIAMPMLCNSGDEPWALYMLDRHSSNWADLSPQCNLWCKIIILSCPSQPRCYIAFPSNFCDTLFNICFFPPECVVYECVYVLCMCVPPVVCVCMCLLCMYKCFLLCVFVSWCMCVHLCVCICMYVLYCCVCK